MTPLDLLRRFVLHIALAGVAWFAMAMLLEKMIPGFISPIIDLPDLALILGVVGVFAVLLHPSSETRLSRLPSLVLSVCILVIAMMILWARINDLGIMGVALILVVITLSVGFFTAHLFKKHAAE